MDVAAAEAEAGAAEATEAVGDRAAEAAEHIADAYAEGEMRRVRDKMLPIPVVEAAEPEVASSSAAAPRGVSWGPEEEQVWAKYLKDECDEAKLLIIFRCAAVEMMRRKFTINVTWIENGRRRFVRESTNTLGWPWGWQRHEFDVYSRELRPVRDAFVAKLREICERVY